MRDPHITSLLEEKSISRLSDDELATVEAHAAACRDCSAAYRAARLAGAMIAARAAETETASPFFKTRVMAAIRERRLSPEPSAWLRIWRAAGTLLMTMAMLVAVLVGATVFNSAASAPPSPGLAINQGVASSDEVIFGADDASDETYDQVFGTIYGSEDGDGD